MKRACSILLPVASVIFLGASFPQPPGWPLVSVSAHASEAIGPGVTYDMWTLTGAGGPLIVHIATVDLHDPHVSLAVATHGGVIVGPDERLSAIADRARAEAAINADYFDINGSGAPLNIVAVGGRFLHQPDAAAAFAIGTGNAVTMGALSLSATVHDAAGASVQINAINDWSTENGLALITPEFGGDAGADLALLLTPATDGSYRVSSAIADTPHLLPLAPGAISLVARGAEAVGRLAAFAPNDVVTLSFNSSLGPIAFAAGGGPLLLSEGRPVVDPASPAPQETAVRYPVTGAGISADGATLWLVAVDGRSPARSVGITRPMLGALFAGLGAAQAMAFDSGGSTEMVVRHLGDAGVSVANTPSDGAERPIADALLVLNNATPGPLAKVLVRTKDGSAAVMAGSHLQVLAAAVDADLQPVLVAPPQVAFSSSAPGIASIDANGVVTAKAVGATTIQATGSGISSQALPIEVVASPEAVAITGYSRDVEAGATVELSAVATMRDGRRVAVDPSAIRWSVNGDGRISPDGSFTSGRAAGTAAAMVQVGATSASLPMLIGEHEVLLAHLGDRADAKWTFSSSPSTVSGTVDLSPAPDRASGLHLDYDFAASSGTRAAYANCTIGLPAEPLSVEVDVFGDSNGEWLRGSYRNADGIVDSITLARRVDWTGWRTLRVAIPPQARWPIAWTRLYVVETRHDAIEAGDLWFRNFNAIEAGPSPVPAHSSSPAS